MTDNELVILFKESAGRIDELTTIYREGFSLSRAECIEFRTCVDRLATIAKELFLRAGEPTDPALAFLKHPLPRRPLPRPNYDDKKEVVH